MCLFVRLGLSKFVSQTSNYCVCKAKTAELKPKTAELKPKTAELKPKKAKDARVTSPRAPRPETPELKPRSPDLRRRPHELKLCIYTMREHDRN